ncbi:hypothetical protein I309_06635 [Cryptococcus deuterogattii LA55]|nr:hypothetical protein I309_06635 [Cryptococcus deuterogattii LA55]
MSDTPSARPHALFLSASAHSQDPICPPFHTASPQHMPITSHPQPLAHEIAHHYKMAMEHFPHPNPTQGCTMPLYAP